MTDMWPLDDYTVDLSSGIPGAYCTHLLAGAGAVIVKMEPPEGDPLRSRSRSGTRQLGLGLRLDRPRGPDLPVDLLDRSDVLVENFSPRVLD